MLVPLSSRSGTKQQDSVRAGAGGGGGGGGGGYCCW